MKRLTVTIMVLCILLCGCEGYSDYIEPENRLLVSAMGIDAVDGVISLSAEAVTVDKRDNSDSYKKTVLSSKGETLSEALQNMKSRISAKLGYGHCSVIIFGENVGNGIIDETVAFCFSNPEITGAVQLAAAENAEDVLKTDGNEQVGYSISAMLAENRELPSAGCGCTIIGTVNDKAKQKGVFSLPLFVANKNTLQFEGMLFRMPDGTSKRIAKELCALLQAVNGKIYHGFITVNGTSLQAAEIKRAETAGEIKIVVKLKNTVDLKQRKTYEKRLQTGVNRLFALLPSETVPEKSVSISVV